MRLRILLLIGLAALLLPGDWACAAGETQAASTLSTNLEGQMESRAAPPSTSGSIGRNLLVLLDLSWKDAGLFAGKVVGFGVLGAVLLSAAGGALGLACWLGLRKYGVFGLPFKWYRYVRWLWCPTFVVCFLAGFAYAGMFWGMGHAFKRGILKDRVADRLVANLYVATALDASKYQLSGHEKVEEIQATLQKSEQLARIVSTNLGQIIRQSCQAQAASGKLAPWKVRALGWVSDSAVGEFVLNQGARQVDPWVLVSVFYALSMSSPESEAFLKENPQASVAVAAISSFLERLRKELCSWASSFVLLQVFAGVAFGAGTPLCVTGVFVLLRKLLRIKAAPGGPGDPKHNEEIARA